MTYCGALIVKEHKTAKATSIRPTEPFTNPHGLPVCGGKITFSLNAAGGCSGHFDPDDACYCDSPYIKVYTECSRCKSPYFTNIDALKDEYKVHKMLEDMLNA